MEVTACYLVGTVKFKYECIALRTPLLFDTYLRTGVLAFSRASDTDHHNVD